MGLTTAKQLFPDGEQIPHHTAFHIFGLDTMRYNSLIAAIPSVWKQQYSRGVEKSDDILMAIKTERSASQKAYRTLTQKEGHLKTKAEAWSKDLGVEISEQLLIKKITHLYIVSNVAKLRSFQYRFLNRAIVLNTHLFHWKIKSSNLCSFCDEEPETLCHLFMHCKPVKALWLEVKMFLQETVDIYVQLDPVNIMSNTIDCKNLGSVWKPIVLNNKELHLSQEM